MILDISSFILGLVTAFLVSIVAVWINENYHSK